MGEAEERRKRIEKKLELKRLNEARRSAAQNKINKHLKVTGSRELTVTIKYGAEACARYEGKCPLCMRAIELEDHIIVSKLMDKAMNGTAGLRAEQLPNM